MDVNSVAVHVAIVTSFLSLLLLPESFPLTSAIQSDIDCLISMKNTLQDPLNYLSSTWNFDNVTEGFICEFNGINCYRPYGNLVSDITLSDLGLKGQFPRGVEKCAALKGLDLSSNQLSGAIPFDIGQLLKYITYLDLSNNQFSGLIPPSIADCSFLGVLKLDNNSLRGPIPRELGLLRGIQTFSVADNRLTGLVPNFSTATPIELDYSNNPGLCGHPSEERCKYAPISDKSNRDLRVHFFSGFITGWAVSTIGFLYSCLYGMLGITLNKLITNKKENKKAQSVVRSLRPKEMEINNNLKIARLEKYITRVPSAELSNATANFSQESLIGIGKVGTMYKATIPNGSFLAIKRLFNSEQIDRQIVSEMMTLGRLRHCRLVPLIGFCLEKNDTSLVYKYVSNGNLYNWLHTRKGEGEIIGHWPLRVKVAVGVAEGLAWLHHECHFRIVHGTISSKSILLDKNFEPQLSNFWEAKFIKSEEDQSSNWSSLQIVNSLGLELYQNDVYCFGIMLLELITRKQPRQLANFIENFCDTSLSDNSSTLFLVDETLIGQGFDDEIWQYLQVAKNCVLSNPDLRPSMLQVHETLAAISKIYNHMGDNDMSN